MKKSFWGVVWSCLWKVQIVLAILVAVLLWVLSPDWYIPLRIALPIGLIFVIFILTFANAAHEILKVSVYLPKVILGKKPSKKMKESKVLCLLEPSELFSHDTVVSFYYIEEGFEELIGIGKVLNVQNDGKILVTMLNMIGDNIKTINRIKQSNSEALKKIKIKPAIPWRYLGDVYG